MYKKFDLIRNVSSSNLQCTQINIQNAIL